MSSTSNTAAGRVSARWTYPLLLAIQTMGAGALLWYALPLYREMAAAPSQHELSSSLLVRTVVAAAMQQAAYWAGLRVGPPQWQGQVVLGHLVRFLGRLSFIATTSVFVLVFIRQPEDLHLPASRLLAVLFGLFCVFCYNLELDRLGNVLQRRG